MKMMKMARDSKGIILVTGAAGRLGRMISAEFISKGYTVRALVKDKSHILGLPAGSIPYLGDVTDRKVLLSACKGANTVIHLAAIVTQAAESSTSLINTNVAGTRNVVEAAKESGVKKLMFASSVDVYGRARREILAEHSHVQPTDLYGKSKALAEQEIIENAGHMHYVIFRIAAIYGHGFESSYFKILKTIREGKMSIIGAGSNRLALIYITDVIKAFVAAVESTQRENLILNLADGEIHTQRGLIEMAAKLLKVPTPSRHVSPLIVRMLARAKGLDSDELRFITSDRAIDITALKDKLRFVPSVDIGTGMKRIAEMFFERAGYPENE